MKKIYIKPVLSLTGILLLFLFESAWATVSVSINPAGGFNIVPGIAVVNQPIATINLSADQDYQVTLRDNNNGLLKYGTNILPYTVKYNNGNKITLSTGSLVVEAGSSISNGSRALTVFISAATSIGIMAGPYTSIVMVEILAI